MHDSASSEMREGLTRVLFICSRNRLRSPTAEAVFSAQPGLEVISAGTNPDAENRVSADDIAWADIIFVMESSHRSRLNKMFGSQLREKRVINLAIPDDYAYMDPKLVDLLLARVPRHLPSFTP